MRPSRSPMQERLAGTFKWPSQGVKLWGGGPVEEIDDGTAPVGEPADRLVPGMMTGTRRRTAEVEGLTYIASSPMSVWSRSSVGPPTGGSHRDSANLTFVGAYPDFLCRIGPLTD